MKCPHCLVEFHDESSLILLGKDADGGWVIIKRECPNPSCKKLIFFLANGPYESTPVGWKLQKVEKLVLIRPKGSNRPPVPSEVPKEFAVDYAEACMVLPDSPKASAALSRRCLQHLFREVGKVKPGNLSDEIQEVIDSGRLPSYLVEVIDAVRNIGNFATHPIKSQKTGEIVPVEPLEAEWNLDVLESLFDFLFVQPEMVKRKRTALNEKLRNAGKKEMK